MKTTIKRMVWMLALLLVVGCGAAYPDDEEIGFIQSSSDGQVDFLQQALTTGLKLPNSLSANFNWSTPVISAINDMTDLSCPSGDTSYTMHEWTDPDYNYLEVKTTSPGDMVMKSALIAVCARKVGTTESSLMVNFLRSSTAGEPTLSAGTWSNGGGYQPLTTTKTLYIFTTGPLFPYGGEDGWDFEKGVHRLMAGINSWHGTARIYSVAIKVSSSEIL